MNLKSKHDIDVFMEQAKKYPILSHEEQRELLKEYKEQGNQKARDKLINHNLRFIVKIAHQQKAYLLRGNLEFADLVQAGSMGLMRAIDKFDLNAKTTLLAYAVWWIRAFMQQLSMANISVVKSISTSWEYTLFFKSSEIKDIINENDLEEKERMRKKLADNYAHITTDHIRQMEARLSTVMEFSMDAPLKNDPKFNAHDLLTGGDPYPEVERELDNAYHKEIIKNALAKLSPREKDFLTRRYLGEEKESLQSIGNDYNISRERVRQVEANALKKLRAILNKDQLVKLAVD